MAGLLPNTKGLEERVSELGEQVKNMADRMVTAQETIVEQNETIISLLTEIRDRKKWGGLYGISDEDLAASLSKIPVDSTRVAIPVKSFTSKEDRDASANSNA